MIKIMKKSQHDNDNWAQNGIIYQIYPLTFNYAKGSKSDPYKGAYGNLKGISEKADYVASLGVDAIWMCPIHPWNRMGFTYDITNYEDISPMFGTKEDLKELVDTYHAKGIKVSMDMVLNHCSMENDWFKKSVKREEPYTDYFVWADGKKDENGKLIMGEDGRPLPPNNWESTWDSSGTSAWCWNEERKQYYMHSFDYSMPNLNINNPKVQERLLKVAKYWFDMGIDCFRLDGTCHFGYDPKLRDNPIIGEETTPNLPKEEIEAERGKQMRIYDINNKIGREFIDKLKELANSYNPPKRLLAEYVFDKGTHGNRKGAQQLRESTCDTFYTGALRGGIKDFRQGVESMLKPQKINSMLELPISPNGSKINWALSNHDMERVASRWFENDEPQTKTKKTKLAMKMLLSLPGSICIFQGEELGLSNPDINRAKNPDNDPLQLSPIVGMPWDAARTSIPFTHKGTNMWLKPTPEQRILAVECQEKPYSMLNATREAIKWRKKSKVLNHTGYLDFIDTDNPEVIAFIRSDEERKNKVALCFNYTDKPVEVRIPLPNKQFKKVKVPPLSMIESNTNTINTRLAQHSITD